jgi:hypothetical protein
LPVSINLILEIRLVRDDQLKIQVTQVILGASRDYVWGVRYEALSEYDRHNVLLANFLFNLSEAEWLQFVLTVNPEEVMHIELRFLPNFALDLVFDDESVLSRLYEVHPDPHLVLTFEL